MGSSFISPSSDVVSDATPQLGGMLDVNGFAIGDGSLELLDFMETASAVNHLRVTNAATGGIPSLTAVGDDANISLTISGKGTGAVNLAGSIMTTEQTLTDAASIAYNIANGNNAKVTITADRALAALTNVSGGQVGILTVIQDGTGLWDLTLDSSYVVVSGVIADIASQAAGKRSFLTWKRDGGSSKTYLWVVHEV